jgi:hypothetical protein
MFVVDETLEVDPDSLSDGELADAVVELRRLQARLAAATARLTAAFDARRVWAAEGSRSAGAWLAHRCRLPAAQTRADVRLARRLQHMAATDRAFADGEIGEPHAKRLAALSVGRTAHCFARDEPLLVDWARTLSWADFWRASQYWRQLADPDGVEQDAATDAAARRLDLWETLNGTGLLKGTLTPVARVALQTALRAIEADLWQADLTQAKEEHGPDASPAQITRTAAQRRHDALVELAHRACSTAGGKRPRPLVSVLVDYPTLAGRVCELGDGTVITPGVVASMLREADIERVVFDTAGRVIDLGRRRSFVGAARRALEVRDRHCTHPGCDAPLHWCQGDHIQPWSRGGTTHPHNGQLRCGHHNRWHWTHRDDDNGPDAADDRPP